MTGSPTTTDSLEPAAIIFFVYLVCTLGIGWWARRRSQSAEDYLNATHALPFVTVLCGYLAANCGALDIVGMSAMAAQYGPQAFHFYWVGAIPAMVFLAVFLMPVYRRNGIASVPEYLELRFGRRMRRLNAFVTAVILLLLAGVSLYAMGQVATVLLGLGFASSIVLCVTSVTVYVLIGGIRATVYNEVLQLGVMIAGFAPLAVRCMHMRDRWMPVALNWENHLWQGMPLFDKNAQMDAFGVIFGLGCILSFSYWCTDFVLMQRAFAARTDFQARQIPIWTGFGKLAFSAIVVLPGFAATAFVPGVRSNYDGAMPELMGLLYGPWMLGLGVTGLSASLMSALAANLSAFASVCVRDIYLSNMRTKMTDAQLLRLSRGVVVAAGLASLGLSYLNFLFSNLMEHVQLIFSVLGAPFWAVFLIGLLTRNVRQRDAMTGFLCGSILSLLHTAAVVLGWLHYGSTMAANFYAAIYGFCVAMTATLLSHWIRSGERLERSSLDWKTGDEPARHRWILCALSVVLLAVTFALNMAWR